MSWQHAAACRDQESELFFPIGTTGAAIRQLQEAKRVCADCPVREACLEWAMQAGADHGVWGGLSEDERRSWKRRLSRNRSPRSTASQWALGR